MEANDGFNIMTGPAGNVPQPGNAPVNVKADGVLNFVETSVIQPELLTHITVNANSNSLQLGLTIDNINDLAQRGLKVQYTTDDLAGATTPS